MKKQFLLASCLIIGSMVFAQSADIERALQKWNKKWAFDDYINGSVTVAESYRIRAKDCFLHSTPILSNNSIHEGTFARGSFYVKRFGSLVKAYFESFAYYEDDELIVRICYKDNMEKRCNY